MGHANRGKFLERLVNKTNQQYRLRNYADIRKIPTPVQITGSRGNMVTGRKETAEWVDYSGVFRGKAIIFDAKETKGKSFPLSNLGQHQYEILKSWHYKGAKSFLLVYFVEFNKYFVLRFELLEWAVKRSKMSKEEGGRKSITYQEFLDMAYEVSPGNGYTLNYLEAYDEGQ